jgi:hypothetical protein
MKLLALFTLMFSSLAYSQRMDFRGVNTSEDTNIQIHHGSMPSQSRRYEIINDSFEIEGDPAMLASEGRDNWKAACSGLKSETTNGSQIISVSCGIPECSKLNYQTTCRSTASRKMRVLVQE